MMNRKPLYLAALVVAALATVLAQERDEVPASPGETLELDLSTGADVRIIGTDRSAVTVETTRKGRDADDVRIDVRRAGRGVRVTSEYVTRQRNRSADVDIVIRLPRRFDLNLDSMGGRVEIEDVEGTLRGRTMGGDLELMGLRGQLDLSTMGGGIRLRSSRVDGKVSTMGGNVTIEDVTGNVDGSSMGGNVVYRNVRRSAAAASPSAKEVRISTMGGDVNVADAVAGANVSTMGGNVRITQASGHVKASTMGGDVRLDAVDGWIEASTMGGNVVATMIGDADRGDRHVKLTSMGGDITLTVPPGLDMRFDITLAYTRNSRQDYEIRSDFPVQQRRTADWEYRGGDARRYIYGTGTVGRGTHVIDIETVNGNVIVRKGS